MFRQHPRPCFRDLSFPAKLGCFLRGLLITTRARPPATIEVCSGGSGGGDDPASLKTASVRPSDAAVVTRLFVAAAAAAVR